MRSLVRVAGFFEQWWVEVIRQPGLMITLIVAPFLLLLAFGVGVMLDGPRPRTIIVQSSTSEQPIDELIEGLEQHVDLQGFEESLPLARRALERGQTDAVIVVPEDVQSYLDAGEQVPLQVLIGEVDPVRRSYARAYLRDQVAALNQKTVEEVVTAAQGEMGSTAELTAEARRYVDLLESARGDLNETRQRVRELQAALVPLSNRVAAVNDAAQRVVVIIPGLSAATDDIERFRLAVSDLEANIDGLASRLESANSDEGLPSAAEIAELRDALDRIDSVQGFALSPEVIAAPFILDVQDVTPVTPSFTSFYSPGVVALLVQHLAITLGALSLSRARLLRVVDMLRVAPVRATEVLLGNYLAYGTVCAIAAAGLVGLLVGVLDVPAIGSWAVIAGAIALLIASSLGIGFIVSLTSSSVQQATQVSMLILLGSIFFSGFLFSLDQISDPVTSLSYLFPASYALRLLQDEMLRGLMRSPEDLAFLGAGALVLFVIAAWLMRRELSPRG